MDKDIEQWIRDAKDTPDPVFKEELRRKIHKKILWRIMKMACLNKFEYWLWGVAERADWSGRFPRRLWSRLLHHFDKKVGLASRVPKLDSGILTEGPNCESKES